MPPCSLLFVVGDGVALTVPCCLLCLQHSLPLRFADVGVAVAVGAFRLIGFASALRFSLLDRYRLRELILQVPNRFPAVGLVSTTEGFPLNYVPVQAVEVFATPDVTVTEAVLRIVGEHCAFEAFATLHGEGDREGFFIPRIVASANETALLIFAGYLGGDTVSSRDVHC